jgi:hypothetical protein
MNLVAGLAAAIIVIHSARLKQSSPPQSGPQASASPACANPKESAMRNIGNLFQQFRAMGPPPRLSP